jgi:hypothetical protein
MIPEKCHSCVSSFIWYFHFCLAILSCLFLFLYQLKHFVHWRLVPKTLPPPTPTQSILFLNKFTLFHAVVVSNRKKKKKKLNPYRRCVCVCVFVVTLWHEENDSPTPPHSALMYREKCVWALLCVWVCKWAPWWKIPPLLLPIILHFSQHQQQQQQEQQHLLPERKILSHLPRVVIIIWEKQKRIISISISNIIIIFVSIFCLFFFFHFEIIFFNIHQYMVSWFRVTYSRLFIFIS